MSINIGDEVPEFSVATDDGGTLSKPNLLGKTTVLYFYPRDDTPGCTQQAQAFRDMHDTFEGDGITVIGISADSIDSHNKFRRKHNLNFALAADTETALARAFGVWVEKSMYGKKYMGMERSTFLVDRIGVVRRIWRKVKVPGHAAEVLEAARAL